MTENNIELILRSVRALQGEITPSLRSVSVELRGKVIIWQCIFDGDATDDDFELMRMASTELIADYSYDYSLDEKIMKIQFPNEMKNLKNLIFLRHESNYYKN